MTASNPILDWALAHLDLGYCPIPTVRGTKGACVPWKPYQVVQPDVPVVVGWFPPSLATERNLALVAGVFHGLVIVDADDEESVRFAKLQFGPSPYRVRTRRGMHFYYRHPGSGIHVQTKARVFGEKGPAVDIRGDGGICTGLGSTHASGFVYRLDDGAEMLSVQDLPVFDPTWLPRQEPMHAPSLYRGGADLSAVQRAERYLDACEGTGKGGRNQNTFRVAASVVRDFGLSFDQGWALLSSWNSQRNDPPLPEEDIRVIVRSCLQSGRRPVGGRLNECAPSGGVVR
jgi:hypothetical protein